jgi:hypothetical protein
MPRPDPQPTEPDIVPEQWRASLRAENYWLRSKVHALTAELRATQIALYDALHPGAEGKR